MPAHSSPISLSEQQMLAVLAAAQPLPPQARSAFLEMCATEIANLPGELGDGALHRVISRVQRQFIDSSAATNPTPPDRVCGRRSSGPAHPSNCPFAHDGAA